MTCCPGLSTGAAARRLSSVSDIDARYNAAVPFLPRLDARAPPPAVANCGKTAERTAEECAHWKSAHAHASASPMLCARRGTILGEPLPWRKTCATKEMAGAGTRHNFQIERHCGRLVVRARAQCELDARPARTCNRSEQGSSGSESTRQPASGSAPLKEASLSDSSEK
jgi:hypothetical protein